MNGLMRRDMSGESARPADEPRLRQQKMLPLRKESLFFSAPARAAQAKRTPHSMRGSRVSTKS